MLSRPPLFLALFLAAPLTGCGTLEKTLLGRSPSPNHSGPDPEVDAPPASTPPETDGKPPVVTSTPSATPPKFDEQVDHTARLLYFQSELSLTDLFSANGSSQLCWPTTLSYVVDYLRTTHRPTFAKLESPDIRAFATLCGTDRTTGTTLPQGVSCIDKLATEAGYPLSLEVTGLDAKWQAFGLFPQKTTVHEQSISPVDLRRALNAEQSVILFVGFYEIDEVHHTWTRIRGHFVAATGFGYQAAWKNDELSVTVVNPGVDYSLRPSPSLPGDVVDLRRITKTDLPALPPDVDFQISGPGFPATKSSIAVVESAIYFSLSD